jgi:hypothetical protein
MSAEAKKRKRAEFRPDSYEATLTAKERRSLYVMLLCGRESLEEIQEQAIPWRSDEKKGQKPEISTLWKIQTRLRMERIVSRVNESCGKLEIYKELLMPMAKAMHQEQLLDWIMTLISEEVIDRTLERLNPEARTAAAKLLLKRADQRRVDRRLDMLEAEFKKETPPDKPGTGLAFEEKEARMKKILGIK